MWGCVSDGSGGTLRLLPLRAHSLLGLQRLFPRLVELRRGSPGVLSSRGLIIPVAELEPQVPYDEDL
jgi:hypothetical protein